MKEEHVTVIKLKGKDGAEQTWLDVTWRSGKGTITRGQYFGTEADWTARSSFTKLRDPAMLSMLATIEQRELDKANGKTEQPDQ